MSFDKQKLTTAEKRVHLQSLANGYGTINTNNGLPKSTYRLKFLERIRRQVLASLKKADIEYCAEFHYGKEEHTVIVHKEDALAAEEIVKNEPVPFNPVYDLSAKQIITDAGEAKFRKQAIARLKKTLEILESDKPLVFENNEVNFLGGMNFEITATTDGYIFGTLNLSIST